MIPDSPTILYGVFRRLLDAGMKLGISDYLDVLRALRLDLGEGVPVGKITRDRLRLICHIVWARTPDEFRLIDAVLRAFPAASAEQVMRFEEVIATTTRGETVAAPEHQQQTREEQPPAVENRDRPQARVDFEASEGRTGIPLPRVIRPSLAVHHDRMQTPIITAVDQRARGRRTTHFGECETIEHVRLEFRV